MCSLIPKQKPQMHRRLIYLVWLLGSVAFAGEVLHDERRSTYWYFEGKNEWSWQRSKQFCENLDQEGFSGWRLPNLDEVTQLRQDINNKALQPRKQAQDFTSQWLWSGTKSKTTSKQAWCLTIKHGEDLCNTSYFKAHTVCTINNLL